MSIFMQFETCGIPGIKPDVVRSVCYTSSEQDVEHKDMVDLQGKNMYLFKKLLPRIPLGCT